ncbi:MAG: DUF447 family protein [Methylococcaceae bacterium]|jgi:hypothetical protein|nr:MAG: DUF447 family protein [Methylococcaceae bacterium]
MIQETIVTTHDMDGQPHLAPMGIHYEDNALIILPFKPSSTLDNLRDSHVAVINYCDDVRVFAGCLTGRRDWPLREAEKVSAPVLACALAHTEVEVLRIEDHPVRPKVLCAVLHQVTHAPFQGFNRAQFAVLEAAILVSRLTLLSPEKIANELAYLRIGFDKTAGAREREAWAWLMTAIDNFTKGVTQP